MIVKYLFVCKEGRRWNWMLSVVMSQQGFHLDQCVLEMSIWIVSLGVSFNKWLMGDRWWNPYRPWPIWISMATPFAQFLSMKRRCENNSLPNIVLTPSCVFVDYLRWAAVTLCGGEAGEKFDPKFANLQWATSATFSQEMPNCEESKVFEALTWLRHRQQGGKACKEEKVPEACGGRRKMWKKPKVQYPQRHIIKRTVICQTNLS